VIGDQDEPVEFAIAYRGSSLYQVRIGAFSRPADNLCSRITARRGMLC
jgi:hypothetical protein